MPARKTTASSNCLHCGVQTANPVYCSNQCQRDYAWSATKKRIEQLRSIPVGTSGHSAIARRYLLETRGRKCELCGGDTWRGQPMPLVLDHIDGNSDDWKLTNLRLVCGNCDMQLPTFKSRNRGHGRAWRRKRYAAGESY